VHEHDVHRCSFYQSDDYIHFHHLFSSFHC
jgi:hypothetical protein